MEQSNAFDIDAMVNGMLAKLRPAQPIIPRDTEVAGGAIKSELSENHVKILKSYVEIPRGSWSNIPVTTYIRYVTKTNDLKTGARVQEIERESNGYSIKLLKVSRGRRPLVWSVHTNSIAKIYRLKNEKKYERPPKPQDAKSAALSKLGDTLLFDNSAVTTRLDMLEARTQRIEYDLKRLLQFVKAKL